LAIVPAAGNITEIEVGDIPTVNSHDAICPAAQKLTAATSKCTESQIIRSLPLTSHWNSSFHAIYTVAAAHICRHWM